MGQFVGNQPDNVDDSGDDAPPSPEAVEPQPEGRPSIREEVQNLLDQGQQVPLPSEEEVPTPSSDTPAVPDPSDESPEVYKLGDYEIPADQVDDVVNLISWASSLTEEQAAAALAATQQQVNQYLDQSDDDEDDYEPEYEEPELPDAIVQLRQTDPTMASAMEDMWRAQVEQQMALQEEIDEQARRFQLLEATTGEDLAQRQQAETIQAEELAAQKFTEQYGELTEQQYRQLVSTAGDLGIVPGLVQQHGMEDGFYRALETAMYANPDFREQTIQQKVQQEMANSQTQSRKENAAGLSTPQAGTNIPEQTPANLPVSERRTAMKRDIEAMLGQS